MKVLADADLFLELFLNRGGSVEAAEHFLQMLLSGAIEVYVTDRCVETIRFYTSKPDIHVGENIVSHIEAMLSDHIILIDSYLIEQARTFPLRDFDSAVELACAIAINLGAIVTQSPENFAGATLPVFSVSGLIERHRLEASLEFSIPSIFTKEDFTKLQEPVLVEAQSLSNDSGITEKSLSRLRQLIKRIVEAETDDFFELAKIAGLNPIKDFSTANLSGLDLRAAKLAGANFIATNFSRANLVNARLAEARLINANLAGAMLVNADLNGASLVSADMKGAKLIRAQLVRANLTGADMTEANLNHADLRCAVLIGCKLDNASLHLASLNHVDLRRSSLTKADFTGASLYGANLSNADLRGADLTDVNLAGATFEQTLLGSNQGLTRATVADLMRRGAIFVR